MLETLAGIGRFILILFEVVLIFNLMIVVHEYGHFLAARWRGLKIEKFQIWFGKAIIKKEINGVQWGLGTIPLGGFVALPQMAPMDAIEGKGDGNKEALPKITPMDKIIVAFAGPLFSLALAFCFALMVWGLGKPQSASSTEPVIGYVEPGSPAEKGGLQEGDRVLSIDGSEIKHFKSPIDSVIERVMFSKGETMRFVVERNGKEVELDIGYELRSIGSSRRKPVRSVGVGSTGPFVVGAVTKNSPASVAGFKVNDVVKTVNKTEILSFAHFTKFVHSSEGKVLQVGIERKADPEAEVGQPMVIALQPLEPTVDPPLPEGKEVDFMVGLAPFQERDLKLVRPGPKPTEQIGESLTMMFRTIGALFSSQGDIGASHMSSAVGIGNIYYQLLSAEYGWLLAIWFSVLLNVNLAVLNMLPFPVLDGGHITIALMEMIRRRPVNVRVLEYVQVACVVTLMGFMLYVTFFDITDLFGEKGVDRKYSFPQLEQVAPEPPPPNP